VARESRPVKAQPPAATPSAALMLAMIAPSTVTDTKELTKLVLKNRSLAR
jgi:hypothetical protein